jgi:[CysO sulfur-carrier protein]-S-L-cysteine hydrolase
VQRIIEHCLEEKPNEACGILTGRSGHVLHAYATENIRHSPVFYEVAPDQQEHVLKAMAERGEELVAIYHSHPTASARPSATDIRLAEHYPEAIRVIISLAGPSDMRAYLIEGKQVHHVAISAPQDAGGTWHDLRPGRTWPGK